MSETIPIPTTPVERLKAYQFANVAGQFLQQGDRASAEGALEKLSKNMGVQFLCEGFYKGTLASDEGMATASNVYGGRHQSAMKDATVGDFMTYFEDTNGGFKIGSTFKDTELRVIQAKLNPYSKMTIGKLVEADKKAKDYLQAALKGPTVDGKEVTDKDILKANRDKLLYQEVQSILGVLTGMNSETLKREAINTGSKNTIDSLKANLLKLVA